MKDYMSMPCKKCGGSGQSMKNAKPIRCPVCEGHGWTQWKLIPHGENYI